MPLWRWPTVLLDWQFAPAWPRMAALAGCLALGFAIGIAGLDRGIDRDAACSAGNLDFGSLVFEPETVQRGTAMSVAHAFSPPARASGSRWLLLGSLALNLFFVGVAVAMAIRAPAPPRWDPDVFVRVERLSATLPPADADILRGAYPGQPRRASRARRPPIRTARRRIHETLRQDPFKIDDLRDAMAKTRAARQAFDQVIQGVFADTAAKIVAGRPPRHWRTGAPATVPNATDNRLIRKSEPSLVRSAFPVSQKVVGMRHSSKALRAGGWARARPWVTMLQTCSLMLPLGGCLLSGDMPEPNLVVPASYDGGPKNPAAAQAALPPLDWWTKFRSRELTALIEEARANNLDIAAAIARIVQADAQARITGARCCR